MSLISFPFSQSNVVSKSFTVGPQVGISNGVKSEVGYVVPDNKNAIINLNFSGFLRGTVSDSNEQRTFPMSVTDYLKTGDVVYAGYSYVYKNTSPYNVTLSWFYNLNGSTIHTETYVITTTLARYAAVCTTIHALELSK
jgi:hypothetical protein